MTPTRPARTRTACTLIAALALPALLIAQPIAAPPPPASPARGPIAFTTDSARDISNLLAPLLKTHDVPALSAALIVGDRIELVGHVGVRAKGSDAKVTLTDPWHLGSCTKSMTATLAAVMVERGEIAWETTIAEVFAPRGVKVHESFAKATLAQLCTNRAGVPHGLDAGGLWSKLWEAKGTPVEQRRALLVGVVGRKAEYAPGTKNVYSNGGFAIAGHMLETVAGKPYEDLMQEHLFAPLGITSAHWGAPGKPGTLDAPRGHSKLGAPIEPDPARPSGSGSDNPIAISPAGRLALSITDWGRYVAAHLRGDRRNPARSEPLLKAGSFEKLHTPPDRLSDYAFGWATPERDWAGPAGNRTVLTHGGSNTMWFAVVWIAPARDMAIIACCNKAEKGDRACDAAVQALMKAHAESAKK
ncbi:MAG: serine hydrolase domain-containing protein [Phycisphaerales bacterium]